MPTAMQTAASTVLTPDHAAPSPNGKSNGNRPSNHSGPDAPLNGHAGAHNHLPDQPTPAGPLDPHPTPHTPHPTPHTPHPTHLSPDQLALTLSAFLDGNMTLAEVCEYAEISLAELHAWAQSDWARERFEMIRQLSKLRDELIQAEAVPRARQVLVHLATIANPSESAASRECRRKAAMSLLPDRARPPRKPRPAATQPDTACAAGAPPASSRDASSATRDTSATAPDVTRATGRSSANASDAACATPASPADVPNPARDPTGVTAPPTAPPPVTTSPMPPSSSTGST